MERYWGLIEALMTFGGVSLFVIWQMRSLKRDVAAREKREREAAETAAKAHATGNANARPVADQAGST